MTRRFGRHLDRCCDRHHPGARPHQHRGRRLRGRVGRLHRAPLRRRRPDVRAAARGRPATRAARPSVVAPDFLAERDRLPAARGRLDAAHRRRRADLGAADGRSRHARGGEMFAPTDIAFTTPTEGVAATAQGRLYRTTDGAESWTLVRGGRTRRSGTCTSSRRCAVSPSGTARCCARSTAGRRGCSSPRAACGCRRSAARTASPASPRPRPAQSLMRTTDGGVTLTAVSPSSRKLLAVAFGSDRRAVAAGEGGTTVLSQDAGATWVPVGERLSQPFTRIRAVSASFVLAVGPKGTLARSTDGGSTWSELGVSTSEDVIDVVVRGRVRRLRRRRGRHGAAHRQRRRLVADPRHRLLRDAPGGAGARRRARCC